MKRGVSWPGAVSLARPRFWLGSWLSTPRYTAQMGHWSEDLVEDLAQHLGGNPDRRLLVELLAEAGSEIDTLAGRSFHPLRRATAIIDSGGLPLVDVPDLQVGCMEATAGPWAVPDRVNPQIATTLQVAAIDSPVRKAAPVADALWDCGPARRRRLTGRRTQS